MKSIPQNIIDRKHVFETYFEIKDSGCWEWMRAKKSKTNPKTYGVFMKHNAHRVSYAMYVGNPEGFMVCHKCDNKPCVNPNHLFLGTALDNTRDMMEKGRGNQIGFENKTCKMTPELLKEICEMYSQGDNFVQICNKTKLSKVNVKKWIKRAGIYSTKYKEMTDGQVVEIRKLRKSGVSPKVIAKMFDIHEGTVSHIYTGKVYGHVKSDFEYDPKDRGFKISAKDVFEIRKMASENIPYKEIAEKFNVCFEHAGGIIRGKYWGHIKTPYDRANQ